MKKILFNLAFAALAVFAFSSCEDVPSPSGEPTVPTKPEVTVTPVTCAEAAAIVQGMTDGATTAETYEITGYITDVYANISKGQQSFWMADTKGGGKIVQAYWANLPEGVAAFTKDSHVKITGQLMRFVNNSGDVITEVKNAEVVILDGTSGGDTTTAEPVGTGTAADPFNVAAAIAYINTLGADVQSDKEVYIKGKVSSNTTTASTISQYGNMTFTMVDEGSNAVFTAFQVYGPGQKKFTSVDQIKVGDEVVVCGKVVNYKGNTPETVGKGASYVVSINGKGEEGGNDGSDNNDNAGEPKGAGTQADPYNVAAALTYITTLADGEKPEALVYTKGQIKEVVKMGTSGSLQFKMQDKNVDNELLVYYCDNLGKNPFKAQTDLKVGDEVIVCGTVQNYKGNTPEYNSGAYLVSLNGKTEYDGSDDKGDDNDNQPTGNASDFSIDLPYTLGANAYDNGAATINGVSVDKTIKIGTSSKVGDFSLNVPAGKLTFYAITWKGAGTADVTLGNQTVTVKANDGAAGNAPYTINVTDADKYEIDVPAATTLNITSDKRIIFFGIKMK